MAWKVLRDRKATDQNKDTDYKKQLTPSRLPDTVKIRAQRNRNVVSPKLGLNVSGKIKRLALEQRRRNLQLSRNMQVYILLHANILRGKDQITQSDIEMPELQQVIS